MKPTKNSLISAAFVTKYGIVAILAVSLFAASWIPFL